MSHHPLISSNSTKQRRTLRVLLGLIELHLQTGRPVGSQTLKEGGFGHLSSATLRNYFVSLETLGYLKQTHISGGRVPTDAAFKVYADEVLRQLQKDPPGPCALPDRCRLRDASELSGWIEGAALHLAERTKCCVALTLPRFASDSVAHIQFVPIGASRLLAILCTQLGLVHTVSLIATWSTDRRVRELAQEYCNWRINPHCKKPSLKPTQEHQFGHIHNEIMIQYLIEHSTSTHQRLILSGLSQLLHHEECNRAPIFAEFLTLLENKEGLQRLLAQLQNGEELAFWIGEALSPHFPGIGNCSISGASYSLHRGAVGAIALIGPVRLPYREIFTYLRETCKALSQQLTHCVYKYHIEVKSPAPTPAQGHLGTSRQNPLFERRALPCTTLRPPAHPST